ncbi:MAG: hypothetical protein AVDCRST_MAG64-1726 [uncultured Phycisphaerae bacterium]|uniref:Uncharacterized protein n=1 Tax=uncultured Phycisphaerae bacterium TaxID=904963 RepID=A0A6J4P5I3_9BACT|nr:MAG: hypothetical protein AVDCRST_MAG64-1726 [uncultured Phycisphaerae bacterium]
MASIVAGSITSSPCTSYILTRGPITCRRSLSFVTMKTSKSWSFSRSAIVASRSSASNPALAKIGTPASSTILRMRASCGPKSSGRLARFALYSGKNSFRNTGTGPPPSSSPVSMTIAR